jgi:hypothetical protein
MHLLLAARERAGGLIEALGISLKRENDRLALACSA